MGRKIKKYILISCLFMITTSVAIVYRLWNKPHESIKDAIPINIMATDLYSQLSQDRADKKLKFINKVVSVQGEVTYTKINQQNQQIILLKTNTPGGAVNCTMEEKANDIYIGNIIIIKGVCIGYLGENIDMKLPGDVFLIRSILSTNK